MCLLGNITIMLKNIVVPIILPILLIANDKESKYINWNYQKGDKILSHPIVRDNIIYFGDWNGIENSGDTVPKGFYFFEIN